MFHTSDNAFFYLSRCHLHVSIRHLENLHHKFPTTITHHLLIATYLCNSRRIEARFALAYKSSAQELNPRPHARTKRTRGMPQNRHVHRPHTDCVLYLLSFICLAAKNMDKIQIYTEMDEYKIKNVYIELVVTKSIWQIRVLKATSTAG